MIGESLRGKHVLVLGSSDGIGLAAAECLLRNGSVVTACGRDPDKLARAGHHLRHLPEVSDNKVRLHRADATNESNVAEAITVACDDSGLLDGVLVVAGAGNFKPILENTEESVTEDLVKNVMPLVFTLKHAVPVMRRGSSVVAVSSISAVQSSKGLSSFGAGKAALDHYVRVAADELGPRGIRVNSVQPGLVKTGATKMVFGNQNLVNAFVDQTPLGRFGMPEDFAATLALLLSDDASWITGQIWAIDGGMTLRAYPNLGLA